MDLSSSPSTQPVGLIAFGVLMIAFPAFVLLSARGRQEPQPEVSRGLIPLESSLVPIGAGLAVAWYLLRTVAEGLSTRVGMGHRSSAAGAAEGETFLLIGFASAIILAAALTRSVASPLSAGRRFLALLSLTMFVYAGHLAFIYKVTRESTVHSGTLLTLANAALTVALVNLGILFVAVLRGSAKRRTASEPSRPLLIGFTLTLFGGAIATWFLRRELLEMAVVWW